MAIEVQVGEDACRSEGTCRALQRLGCERWAAAPPAACSTCMNRFTGGGLHRCGGCVPGKGIARELHCEQEPCSVAVLCRAAPPAPPGRRRCGGDAGGFRLGWPGRVPHTRARSAEQLHQGSRCLMTPAACAALPQFSSKGMRVGARPPAQQAWEGTNVAAAEYQARREPRGECGSEEKRTAVQGGVARASLGGWARCVARSRSQGGAGGSDIQTTQACGRPPVAHIAHHPAAAINEMAVAGNEMLVGRDAGSSRWSTAGKATMKHNQLNTMDSWEGFGPLSLSAGTAGARRWRGQAGKTRAPTQKQGGVSEHWAAGIASLAQTKT